MLFVIFNLEKNGCFNRPHTHKKKLNVFYFQKSQNKTIAVRDLWQMKRTMNKTSNAIIDVTYKPKQLK